MPSGVTRAATETAARDKTLSEEMKVYFEALLSKHTQTILERVAALELKLQEKDRIIEKLEERERKREERINSLEENVYIVIDDAEHYGRRMNIRLENIAYDEKETDESLKLTSSRL